MRVDWGPGAWRTIDEVDVADEVDVQTNKSRPQMEQLKPSELARITVYTNTSTNTSRRYSQVVKAID